MNTKFYYLFIILLLSQFIAAQEVYNEYLFNKFTDGTAYKNEKKVFDAKFNYNVINQKLVFLSNTDILEPKNSEDITHIIMGDRYFEKVKNNLYYEKFITDNNGAFYIRWKSKIVKVDNGNSYYGAPSKTSTAKRVNKIESDGSVIPLKVTDDTTIKSDNSYYVKIDNNFKQFKNFTSLAKIFNKKDLEKYVKENNLDFNNNEDLREAIKYCYSNI